MKFGSFLITILIFYNPMTLEAVEIQDLKTIKHAAKTYALTKTTVKSNDQRRVEIRIGNLDPRLRLIKCSEDLIIFTPPGSRLQGNTTLGVRCNSPKTWSIYIALKISIFEKAIVSIRKMTRGDIIAQNDISLTEVDTSRVRGRSFVDYKELVGTKLKTSLKANQVISSTAICLICKGDAVAIRSNNSSVSVSVAGIALNDGGKGDKIRVQNNSSRRIVDATITKIGVVSVDI
ncbi:MAG: flagella basal body P-ring formation protein FlgA [Gammaproteobacteria bacterium]|nr:MAG: flagella basal body P-ring formation protein FlgA [Gammaproteobacteria bacterium]